MNDEEEGSEEQYEQQDSDHSQETACEADSEDDRQNVLEVWQDVESEDDADGGEVDEQAHWQIGWELQFGWKEDAGDIRSPRHGRKCKGSKSGGEAYP